MPEYTKEEWFRLLRQRCYGKARSGIAAALGVSAPMLSQVLNGTGKYGSGEASTARLAERVLHTFGRYVCPHLTLEAGGVEQVISAAQCRSYAHCAAPTGSPRAMQHWQACRNCDHKDAAAPPVQRDVQPRPKRTKKEVTHESDQSV